MMELIFLLGIVGGICFLLGFSETILDWFCGKLPRFSRWFDAITEDHYEE